MILALHILQLEQLQSSVVIETTKCCPEPQASSSVTCRYLWHCNSFHTNVLNPLWILPIPVCELFSPTNWCCSSRTCTWRPTYQHLTPMVPAFSDLTSLLHDTISLNYYLRHCPSFNSLQALSPEISITGPLQQKGGQHSSSCKTCKKGLQAIESFSVTKSSYKHLL